MAIYRKNGKGVWYAEVYVRGVGKLVRFSTKKTDEAEAREIERAYRMAHNRSLSLDRLHAMLDTFYGAEAQPISRGVTIADAFARYAAQVESGGNAPAKKTMAARKGAFARFAQWRRANFPACVHCSEVTRSVAGRFAAAFNETEGLSDKTKREVVSDLGTIWNVLMSVDESIRENPWRFFRKRVTDSKSGRAFSREQEIAVLSACKGTEWHTACVVSRWTGLRLKDVCHLRWESVDLANGVIAVVPEKTSRHGIAVTIPMSRALMDELASLAHGQEYVMPELCAAYGHFHFARIGPFSAVLARAGVGDGFTFHSWRHTFASRLADAGVRTEIIKKLGGWTQTATALHYQHSDRLPELREAIGALERQ